MKNNKLSRVAKSKSARNSIWIIGEKISQMLISFIITILSARYLGPSNYGILSYGISFVTFFTSIVKLGIDSVIVKELIDHPKKEGTLLGTSIVYRLLSSGISILLIFACVLILKPNETITIITTVLQSISLVFLAINIFDFWFQSKLQSKYVSIAKITSYSIAGAYKLFLLMNGYSVEWFALSSTIDYLLICVLLYLFYKRKGGQKLHFDKQEGVNLLKKSYHFIISGLMIVIYTQIDKIMIGSMLDAAQVGYYAAAISIHSAFGFIPEALIISARPVLFQLQNTDAKKYARRLKQTFAIIFWSCVAFALVATIASKLLIKYTYGEDYLEAIAPLIILVWAVPFAYIGNVRGIWTVGVGLQKYIKRYLALGAIINVVLNAILIPFLGISGAAIATLATEIFTGIFAPMFYKETRVIAKITIQSILLRINKD